MWAIRKMRRSTYKKNVEKSIFDAIVKVNYN